MKHLNVQGWRSFYLVYLVDGHSIVVGFLQSVFLRTLDLGRPTWSDSAHQGRSVELTHGRQFNQGSG